MNHFSNLARNPDKKAFMTRVTVSLTAISGQNSYPPVRILRNRFCWSGIFIGGKSVLRVSTIATVKITIRTLKFILISWIFMNGGYSCKAYVQLERALGKIVKMESFKFEKCFQLNDHP